MKNIPEISIFNPDRNETYYPDYSQFTREMEVDENRNKEYTFGKLVFRGTDYQTLYSLMKSDFDSLTCILYMNGNFANFISLPLIGAKINKSIGTIEIQPESAEQEQILKNRSDVEYNVLPSLPWISIIVPYSTRSQFKHNRFIDFYAAFKLLIENLVPTISFASDWADILKSRQGFSKIAICPISDFILNDNNTEKSNQSTVLNLSFKAFEEKLNYMGIGWQVVNGYFSLIDLNNIQYSSGGIVVNQNFQDFTEIEIEKPEWTRLTKKTESTDPDFKGFDIKLQTNQSADVTKEYNDNNFLTDLDSIQNVNKSKYSESVNTCVMAAYDETTTQKYLPDYVLSGSDYVFNGNSSGFEWVVNDDLPNANLNIYLGLNQNGLFRFDFNVLELGPGPIEFYFLNMNSQAGYYYGTLDLGQKNIAVNLTDGIYSIIFRGYLNNPDQSTNLKCTIQNISLETATAQNIVPVSNGLITGLPKPNIKLSNPYLELNYIPNLPSTKVVINNQNTTVPENRTQIICKLNNLSLSLSYLELNQININKYVTGIDGVTNAIVFGFSESFDGQFPKLKTKARKSAI